MSEHAENAAALLWLVTMQGVYDHGACFVAETEADAVRFTQEYAPDRDGYHCWRIDPIEVGVPAPVAVRRGTPPGGDA